jgi:hypothetical protein
MMSKATLGEQTERIDDAIETAILQAAEISGFRDWLLQCHLKSLAEGEWPNEEAIVQGKGDALVRAFESAIDPDAVEYLKSNRHAPDLQAAR